MRNEIHAKHFLGNLGGVSCILGDLHASALSPATRMNLRLYNNATADFLCCRLGLFDCIGDLPPRHWNIILCENRLRLILVNLHICLKPK